MRTVAILCCSRNSIYHRIPGTDCYDIDRNAWGFNEDFPIVAHPPCRSWSAFTRHQAKPSQGEKELALFCIDHLWENGGILEQPAYSRLFSTGCLPLPGDKIRHCFTLEINQSDFGLSLPKKTWLGFFHIPKDQVKFPIKTKPIKLSKFKDLSKKQRAETPPLLANWLVETARFANPHS